MALYTFLVPFIAPIFFKNSDPVVQLIMAYGLTAIGVITRPIGSILFGRLAMSKNPKTLLIITLAGVSLSTFAIGLIPGYDSIGHYAVLILFIVRLIQGIFAAGEQSIASILLLEQIEDKARTKISSYYVASSMMGATLASLAATIVSMSSHPEIYWRYAFLSGLITGIAGLALRYVSFDFTSKPKVKHEPIRKIVSLHKTNILRIIFISSFSYMTYSVPFVFFNKFVPLFTEVTLTEMMSYNSILLVLDMLMVPIFGYIAQNFNYTKWMMICAIILGITAVPAFYLLGQSSLVGITAIKCWIIVLGIAFVTPSKVWMFNLIGGKERYLITGLGYAIGTEILGRQTTTICWTIWHYTESVTAPAYYIVVLSIMVVVSLYGWKK
jgi:MFS family permease